MTKKVRKKIPKREVAERLGYNFRTFEIEMEELYKDAKVGITKNKKHSFTPTEYDIIIEELGH